MIKLTFIHLLFLSKFIPVGFDARGLAIANNTLLYASSWKYRNISSFSYQNVTWKYQPFRKMATYDNYCYINVDEYGRIWQIFRSFILRIFNQSGIEIVSSNLSTLSDSLYDLIFLPKRHCT